MCPLDPVIQIKQDAPRSQFGLYYADAVHLPVLITEFSLFTQEEKLTVGSADFDSETKLDNVRV